jgi:hypothetical protein
VTRASALLGALVGALFLVHAAYLCGVAEDAFISFRFGRNLALGHGLVWNPGEPAVEGYTNFLWVLFSALCVRLGLSPAAASQALGVAASLVTLIYTFRCGTRLLGWSAGMALLPCLLLACSGPFAAWAGSGMETNLFGTFLLVGIFHFACYWREGRSAELRLCAGALLLCVLTRPEGALVAALLAGVAWLAAAGRRASLLRDLALPAGLGLALFALYFLWRWSYFGFLLPNTYYAKTGGGLDQYLRGLRYVALFGAHYALPWAPLLALAAWRRRAHGRPAAAGSGLGARLREHALLGSAAALAAVYLGYVVWVGGDYMAMYRFVVPLLPLLALLLAAAAQPLLRDASAGSAGVRAGAGAALAVGVLGTLVHSTPLEVRLFAEPERMHGNWRGVQTERWHVARLSAIGEFFAGYGRGSEEGIATDAIGAIAWYSDLRVYGVHGLVDPDISHQGARTHRLGRDYAGHDRRDMAGLFARSPTFVMFTRELKPKRPRGIEVPGEIAEAMSGAYRLQSVWLEDPRNGEAGWFSFLERSDRRG